MKFTHNQKQYCIEPATGSLLRVEPSDQLDEAFPLLVQKETNSTGNIEQVTMEVSQQCNLRCTYCPHTHGGIPGVRPHRDVHMTREIAARVMAMVDERGAEDVVICFYGGEPLLNLPLIKYVVEGWPQYKYQIDTNSQLVDGDLAIWAARFDIGWQISVDGGLFENDRYRGEGSWFGVVDAVRWIRGARPETMIRFAVTLAPPWAIEHTANQFQYVTEFNDFPFTVNFADLTGSPIKPEPLDLSAYRQEYFEARRDDNIEMLPRLISSFFEPDLIKFHARRKGRRFERWTPGGCCDPAVRRLHVSAEGDLYPCEKTDLQTKIGDVVNGVEWEAVGQLHQEFHMDRIERGCQDCGIVRLCPGCWANPIDDCDAERKRWENVAKLYIDLAECGAAGWLNDTTIG